MDKKQIIEGQIITVKCKEHGSHIGEVSYRDEERVLLNPDFVAPIYDVLEIIKQPKKTKEEVLRNKSKFI